MDDKELTKKIKNSFSAGLSRAEITRRLQKKGYKLEYIDALINKSKSKKFVIFVLVIMVLILGVISYIFLFNSTTKLNIANPLRNDVVKNVPKEKLSDIEITPQFLNYLLNEVGAYKLHKNILTGEPAIINFRINEKNFYSEVNKNIQTFEGSHQEPDILILTSKQEILNAISQNPEQYIKSSVQEGKTKIAILAAKVELLAKGYISVYNSFKF